MWGLLYILIWEGFVAQANASAARLAIRSYTRSLLAETADVYLRLADIAVAAAWLVPLVRRHRRRGLRDDPLDPPGRRVR